MKNHTLQTISVVSENRPGILYRVAGILQRRKINIESLEVHAINTRASQFTITIYTTPTITEKLSGQIAKIIEVKEVHII